MVSQLSTSAKSRPSPTGADALPGYLAWSRDPAVGLFVVLPLWITYELLRFFLAPGSLNGAEYLIYQLPPVGVDLLSVAFGITVLVSAWSILQRDIPWLRVGMVTVFESLVYGLMIGPIAAALISYTMPSMDTRPPVSELAQSSELWANMVGALGAGIYEELVFRFLLLSLLAWALTRTFATFGLPRWPGVVLAMLISSLLFALLHHVGQHPGQVEPKVFLFRTMAGLLLALLFVFRGIGVCVYTHALYNVCFYLARY